MLLKVVKSPIFWCLVCSIVAFVSGSRANRARVITKVDTVTNTKVITIDKPVITEKVINTVITDPSSRQAVGQLLAQNTELRGKITQLSVSLANITSVGGVELGGVIEVPTTPDQLTVYRDYQLTAQYSLKDFKYALNQDFTIINLTGRNKDGSKAGATGLFQKTPQGLTNIPVETINVFTDNTSAYWFVSPRIQAGYARMNENGAVLALQWLKRGKSALNEETRYAVLSPAFFISNGQKEFGILPISLNVGSIKHSPFTNIWLSPLLTQRQIGGTITATF